MNISGKIIEVVDNVATPYCMELFDMLGRKSSEMFTAFVGIWFLWQLIFKGILQGDLVFAEFVKKLFLFSFIAFVLPHHNWFLIWFYLPLNEVVQGLLANILQMGINGEIIASTRNGMLDAVDGVISQIINIFTVLVKGSYFMDFEAKLAGGILLIPYIILLCIFLAYVIEFIFTLLIITAISPLLFIALGFSITSGVFIGGVRVVFQEVLNLVLAVIAISLALMIVNQTLREMTLLDGMALRKAAIHWVFGEEYWACLISGAISCVFLVKTRVIASSMTGSIGGVGSSAALSGLSAVSKQAKNIGSNIKNETSTGKNVRKL